MYFSASSFELNVIIAVLYSGRGQLSSKPPPEWKPVFDFRLCLCGADAPADALKNLLFPVISIEPYQILRNPEWVSLVEAEVDVALDDGSSCNRILQFPLREQPAHCVSFCLDFFGESH